MSVAVYSNRELLMNQMYATAMMWIVSAIALSVTVCVAPLQSQTVLAQPLQQLGWLPAPNPEFSAARAAATSVRNGDDLDCLTKWHQGRSTETIGDRSCDR